MRSYQRRIHQLLARSFAQKRARRASPAPVISFTFDDFPKSALTVAGKMLIAYGWRGTYYASLGLMGKTTEVGPMFTRDDLDDLLTAGHELACHTFEHSSCLAVGSRGFLDSCASNRQQAATMLNGYRLRNMSFPYGHITLTAKSGLRAEYDTCRSIESGLNVEPVDLGFLRANPIYEHLEIDSVKQLIRANHQANGWLILYTHDVSTKPSPYGCSPEYFEEVLNMTQGSATVLPIHEAARRYCTAAMSADPVALS